VGPQVPKFSSLYTTACLVKIIKICFGPWLSSLYLFSLCIMDPDISHSSLCSSSCVIIFMLMSMYYYRPIHISYPSQCHNIFFYARIMSACVTSCWVVVVVLICNFKVFTYFSIICSDCYHCEYTIPYLCSYMWQRKFSVLIMLKVE